MTEIDTNFTQKTLTNLYAFVLCFPQQSTDPRKNANINPNYSVRGKLQSRRCKLNKEINKELRLRAGAENLYKVSKYYYMCGKLMKIDINKSTTTTVVQCSTSDAVCYLAIFNTRRVRH